MVELFRDFWWLAFPLAWGVASAWRGWLTSRSRRDEMRLMATYAKAGHEPPEALIKALGRTNSKEG